MLFALSVVAVIVAVIAGYSTNGDGPSLATFVVALAIGLGGLLGSPLWCLVKVREYMRVRSLELDELYPGFYQVYETWRRELNDRIPDP